MGSDSLSVQGRERTKNEGGETPTRRMGEKMEESSEHLSNRSFSGWTDVSYDYSKSKSFLNLSLGFGI